MSTSLIHKFFDRGIDWLWRPRALGIRLVGLGVGLLVVTFGLNFLAQVDYKGASGEFHLRLYTGEGPPMWASIGGYALGSVLIVFGLLDVGRRAWLEMRRELRQRLIVVELRGLHGSPDTPAKDAELGEFLGERQWLPLDFRPKSASELVDPRLMLQCLGTLLPTIQTLAAGRDKSDVFLAVGGLAAVPALFLTGMLMDDESRVTLYDWDRNVKDWRLIDGPDDGVRFRALEGPLDTFAGGEVVLAVTVSYAVTNEALVQTFGPSRPVFRLACEEVVADRCWSSEKQLALVVAFRDSVQALMQLGATKVHLALAAPSSLSIRMGMAYDSRLLPELVVYQYEMSSSPPYPWGVAMPTHGKSFELVAL